MRRIVNGDADRLISSQNILKMQLVNTFNENSNRHIVPWGYLPARFRPPASKGNVFRDSYGGHELPSKVKMQKFGEVYPLVPSGFFK